MEKLDEVVKVIKDSKEYKTCIDLKKQMESNEDINSLVKKIKVLQKKYIRTNDKDIKLELDNLEKELNEIPIYHIYMENLSSVNDMINYVKDELNNYFDLLLNEKKY